MGEKTLKRKDLNLVLAKIAEKWQGNGDWKLEKKRCHLKNNNTTITTQLLLLLTPSPTPQKQKKCIEKTHCFCMLPPHMLCMVPVNSYWVACLPEKKYTIFSFQTADMFRTSMHAVVYTLRLSTMECKSYLSSTGQYIISCHVFE